MATDARISAGLPAHPKTKKLLRKLGQAAGWNLVCLFLWAAANRSDGDLSGMSAEDIEIAADWSGEDGAFVAALVSVRFLDGEDDSYSLHDWAEHNPWAAGAEQRSAKARWNAVRRHHGAAEADRQVPEYAAVRAERHAASNAVSSPVGNAESDAQHATSMHDTEHSTAPSPSPSPSPSPTPTYEHPSPAKPAKAEPTRFDRFWAAYPKKVGKDAARKAFDKRKVPEELLGQMLQAIERQRTDPQWVRDGGQYIPHPSTWLNEGRWQDEAGDEPLWATRGVAL
jgi:hypothetical protein